MFTDGQKLWEIWEQTNNLYSSWAAAKNVNYYVTLVLYTLEGQTATTQKKICSCTGLTKQTVNSVIRSLREEGYVELTPGDGDRREKRITLTPKGIVYCHELIAPLQELERRTLQIMGEERVQQMVDNIVLFNTVLKSEIEKEK